MNRKTLILGGVLIVLIALAYLYQGPLREWQNNLGKPKNFFTKIDTSKINKMEIISAGQTVTLAKQDDILTGSGIAKWKYNNSKDFYADPVAMAEILSSLDRAGQEDLELVSNNSERKNEFELDDSGLNVKIYLNDKTVADFIIGAQSGDYSGSYVSVLESPAVYLAKADLRGAFTPEEWRDLTIFSSAKEKINKIRFQYPNREFTVELKEGKWSGVLPEKFAVDEAKIGKIAQIMANLAAVEIPEQNFTGTGLEKHLIIIEATGEAIDNILMIGDKRDDLYYAKRGQSDNIYLINKADRDELDKWIWQLK